MLLSERWRGPLATQLCNTGRDWSQLVMAVVYVSTAGSCVFHITLQRYPVCQGVLPTPVHVAVAGFGALGQVMSHQGCLLGVCVDRHMAGCH
jgi:hypothetical protein